MRDKRLGILALGETPRLDVIPTIRSRVGAAIEIVERGGLDGCSAGEIESLRALAGEESIETRLRDGGSIELARFRLVPRLVSAAESLFRDCSTVMLLCSGDFPDLTREFPRLVLPARILRGVLAGIVCDRVMGIIGPASDMTEAPEQWEAYCRRVECEAASPYGPEKELERAARNLASRGAEYILLDDMGFSEDHGALARAASALPLLCPSSLVAVILKEIL